MQFSTQNKGQRKGLKQKTTYRKTTLKQKRNSKWSEFRFEFGEKKWQNIIWNNKDIRISNKSIFYNNFFESGIIYVKDLLLKLNNIDSYNIIYQPKQTF